MTNTEPRRISFNFEVHPGGSVDGLRDIVTKDFKGRFGDIDFNIAMNKVKDNGKVRVYSGTACEII